MLWVRPCHAFYLALLAVADCTNASLPDTQPALSGSAFSRPNVVIVNGFTYSPELSGVDRELVARLEAKFGGMSYDITKALAARRVSDEIVATTIVIVHTAGLNVRPGTEDSTPKNGALVINGRLRTVAPANRESPNVVTFGGGDRIVADVTVSEMSEAGEKQVLEFTAQPPIGPIPNAAVLNAAVGTVLANKSAADVILPPKVEALARGLGRATADRIIAYAKERGWVTEANVAAISEDVKSEKARKREKPPQANATQEKAPAPEAKIPCEAFTKNARGNWYVSGPVRIDIGGAKNRTLQDLEISPKFYTIGGVDLYDAIQKACGNL